ncbi:MAG: hypothetical protein KIT13_08445 [Burkholderiales bacterium]|nr:hypothetical protein [Burkholderiales bacterium]MCW5604127.1 hypothetical protein [Burkholderiales bacterium]
MKSTPVPLIDRNSNWFVRLILSFGVCLCVGVFGDAVAAKNVSANKGHTASSGKRPAENMAQCEFITDSQGKKSVHARMGEFIYKFPYEYIGGGTCSPSSVILVIRWPSLRGFKARDSGGGTVDAYRVILMPPKVPVVVDRYVSLTQVHRFDGQQIPSKYPGLSFLKKDGKQWSVLVSGEKWPKTPSGNPFVFRVGPPLYGTFDTTFVIPSGPTIRINDGRIHKYMNEWDRLFPALINLIQSFGQKE